METKKQSVLMVLPTMAGGGAERVAAMLLNEFNQNGYDTAFLLTHIKRENVVNRDLNPEIPLLFLEERCRKKKNRLKQLAASFLSRLFEWVGRPVPARIAYFSFVSQYQSEISAVREILLENPKMTVVTFLQPAIPIVLLAARGLPNRIVISERADPGRLMKKRYGYPFVKKYYQRADAAVFQTEDAKNGYPDCIARKGTVIPNPLKENLPKPYSGERTKNITTFCRISAQKNLLLLLKAFLRLHAEFPEYVLRIIGNANNDDDRRIETQLKQFVQDHSLESAVVFEPFTIQIHEAILRDAMYVNSSDYEGISNAMLEAMAIGLPVVCTDCPIGGAKQTIVDGENGLLVPINDPTALYRAMKRLIEDPELARSLSANAVLIRQKLAIEKIAQKWIKLLKREADD